MEIHPILDPYAIHFTTFAGDVYTLSTASITLTAGHIQAVNFTTDEDTNHTVFVGDDAGGSGTNNVYVGEHAGENATSDYGAGVGNYVLQNNTGSNPVANGFATGQDNTGDYLVASGYATAQRNKGAHLTVSGGFAGQDNLGDDVTLAGYLAGQYNTENNLIGVGNSPGQWNTGANPTIVGNYGGRYNNSDNITVAGFNAFNTWTDDTPSEKAFDNTDVVAATDRITLTGHSLGANNSYINLVYTEGTSAITGLTDGVIYQWKIIDVNTIELRIGDITDAGSGTGHKLTPSVYRANSTALGYDAEPDAANQVMLGDGNVTQVKSAAGIYLAGGTFTVSATGELNASGDTTTATSADSNSTTIQTGDGYDFINPETGTGGDTGDLTIVTGEGGDGYGGNAAGDSGDWVGGSGDAGAATSAGPSPSGDVTLKTGISYFAGFGAAQTGDMLLQTGDTSGGAGIAGDITISPGRGNTAANSGAIIFDIFTEVARFTNAGDLHFKDDKKIILGDDSDLQVYYDSNLDIVQLAADASMQFGTPSSNYTEITPAGRLIFVGSAAIPHGAFYGNNIAWTSVAFGGGGTFVIISDSDITGGNARETAFQNNQELLIGKAGVYLVTWTISGECAGANKHLEVAPGINGTASAAGRNHFETGNANQEYAIAGTAILTLAATNTLSLMLTNVDDNTQVEVHHINLTAVQVGG